MDAVKSFNAELSSLYEVKPPISKAKMTAITRGAIKAIKFYKHVVQSVEKFILKCKPEYKVPGLYVIDSIVRQSRHQFGPDKDVFAPRFAKNMRQTFINLFSCPAEDKSKVIRVLNLWQKNQVFAPEVIQPLFDLADPNNPIHKELGTPLQSNGMGGATALGIKGSPALQKTPTKGSQQDGAHLGGANLNLTDPSVLMQLQQLQRLLTRSDQKSDQVHFDRKLLDFDYGDDDDEAHSSPKAGPATGTGNDSVSNLLTNPEVLRQLQTLQQTMSASQQELDIDKLRKLQEMKQQEDEFDKHLAQTVPNLPFAAECEFKPGNTLGNVMNNYYLPSTTDMSQPPPGYKPLHDLPQSQNLDNDVQFVSGSGIDNTDNGGNDVEVINLDHSDSRSPSPSEDRYRRRRSRSRDRSRDRRRSRRSRSRSRSRRHRSSRSPRDRKPKEKESEKDKERKKRGLPTIKKENLSVCSTTLWVGHLSKLVHQEDLSNTFGEFGDIVSIDLIPPRGCAFIVMHRRQDAARCLTKLKNHLLHGKAITLAWAPGKGVKGKDLKDYWEGDLGVSYIPWHKLKPDIDIEMLEDGGMIDEDTMPGWMKAKVAALASTKPTTVTGITPGNLDARNYINDTTQQQQQPSVDTSQPPPVPGGGLLQPPPMALPLVAPFQFGNRLLGIPPTMLPNVPIGVPPPNISSALMTPNQLVGLTNSPFHQTPTTANILSQISQQQQQQQQQQEQTQNLDSTNDNLMQPFGMIPQPPVALPAPHDDNMDIEMEDAEKPIERPMLLSEQLQASMAQQFNQNNKMDDRRGLRNSSRERDRNRSRNYDDRKDRPNRWSDRDIDPHERREREKTLNDRLQQMAMPNEAPPPPYSNHDRPPRDDADIIMERRMFKGPPPINPDMDEMYMRNDDYIEPPMIDEYHQPPPPMMDHPDEWMHMRMQHRDEYEHERFARGRRDFREPRGRGDYYREGGFGPRPPIFPPRPPMRGGGGPPHKFHPRGPPPMRGPRPNRPFHRGPPGLYDDQPPPPPPHLRHRGRFDDRRRPLGHFGGPEAHKRSRWSGESQEENVRGGASSAAEEEQEQNEEDNRGGGNTPLHDEPFKDEEIPQEQNEESVEEDRQVVE